MDVARLIAWALARRPVRAFLRYSEHRGPILADSVTYRALFSIFAGVLLGFSFAALWLAGNPAAWAALVDAVDQAIPGLVGPDGLIDVDAISAPAGLTIAGAVSLVGLIGAAIGAIGSLRTALHTIADRPLDDVLWIWVILRNLLLALGVGVALAVSASVTVLGTAGVGTVAAWFGWSDDHPAVAIGTRVVAIAVTYALDAIVLIVVFRMLSGIVAPARAFWVGALIGAVGLTVLQTLSGLFVGGATSNPLLATFGALIALLLWVNLSSQVILIAGAYVVESAAEDADRLRVRHGARTFAERKVQTAEDAVAVAASELASAREALAAERSS